MHQTARDTRRRPVQAVVRHAERGWAPHRIRTPQDRVMLDGTKGPRLILDRRSKADCLRHDQAGHIRSAARLIRVQT
jgi:hypothetical protein